MGRIYKNLISERWENRISERIIPSKKIISWGKNNDYPQRVKNLVKGSSTAISSIGLMTRFLVGKGFNNNTYNKIKVNRYGQTMFDLLYLFSNDLSKYNTFCFHVNYNLNYKIKEIQRIEPTMLRLSKPDSSGYNNKVVLNNNWDLKNKQITENSKPLYINFYDPREDVVANQIDLAGGINKYDGQIYFHTWNRFEYPLAIFDSVLTDLDVEARISEFNLKGLKSGFMPRTIIGLPFKHESDEDRIDFRNQIHQFQGVDGQEIMVIEKQHPDKSIDIHQMNLNVNDGQFKFTEESTRAKIVRTFNQPTILHSDFRPGALGGTTEIQNAFSFYNQVTDFYRMILIEKFKDINNNYWSQLNIQNDLDIEKLSFSDNLNTQAPIPA